MRHVILGNGAAGITAVVKIRELSPEDDITIVSSEDTPVYSKPMLPDYIGGKIDKDKLYLRDFSFYTQNNIKFIAGNRALRVDPAARTIILADQGRLEYDKLLVCTGGVPFIPPIEGLADTEYFILNSIADAERIKERTRTGGKAVIIGAGLTGVEVAFAVKRMGMDAVIIEREKCVLPMLLDQYSSKVMEEELISEGIGVILGKTVSKVAQDCRKKVIFSDGDGVEFDILVLAIGTRPNVECVKDSGIACNRGILVNEYMETSEEDVYAAGDASELKDNISTEFVSTYVWPNAMLQGRCAACSMTGKKQEFSIQAAMQNTVQLRDIPFMSMGMVNPKTRDFEILVHHERESKVYKRLTIRNNVIKGMVFIGDVGSGRAIADLIRKGTDVSGLRDRLFDKDFRA